MTGRTGKTMREERRTYRRRRCTYREATGAQCRSVPAQDSPTCLLHTEVPRETSTLVNIRPEGTPE